MGFERCKNTDLGPCVLVRAGTDPPVRALRILILLSVACVENGKNNLHYGDYSALCVCDMSYF